MNNARIAPSPMSNEQIMTVAPSVFAPTPWERMSAKYAFIPSIEVVDRMRSEGFIPVSATQGRTRIPGKGDFTRHQIRFRDFRSGTSPVLTHLGQIFPEVVLTNSHDGTSSYILDGGLFRLICFNGAVVSEAVIQCIRTHHKGDVSHILRATLEIVNQFPKVIDSVESFASIQLTQPERVAFGTAALALRYDDDAVAPITPTQAVQPRRNEDKLPNLWNVFNSAQENLTQGGLDGVIRATEERVANGAAPVRRAKTRPVTGIGENTKLNKALWTLAEEMRKLKSVQAVFA